MIKIARWILFIPISFVAGYTAYLVGGFVNNASYVMFTGVANDFSQYYLLEPMAHMYLGGALVYAGVRIAPSHPKTVAMALVALLIFISGASVYASLMQATYNTLPSSVGVLFGGFAVYFATLQGEVSSV